MTKQEAIVARIVGIVDLRRAGQTPGSSGCGMHRTIDECLWMEAEQLADAWQPPSKAKPRSRRTARGTKEKTRE